VSPFDFDEVPVLDGINGSYQIVGYLRFVPKRGSMD